VVVNFLQVDIIDGDAFLDLFLEELHGVILQTNEHVKYFIIIPRRRGALSDTAIRPSVPA